MSKGQRQRSHNHSADHGREGREGSSSKALQRVEKARALYVKSEHRVANARLRLMQAEEKLARRASRLSSIEDTLAATAAVVDQAPVREARVAASPIIEEPTTPEQAADMVELAAIAMAPHAPELHTNGASPADTTAPVLVQANGTTPVLVQANGTASSGDDGSPILPDQSQGQSEKGRREPRPRTGGRRKPAAPSSDTAPMPEES